MKQLFLIAIALFVFSYCGKCQLASSIQDTIKVILETDKLKVTEYLSTPGKDVCGKGMHSHKPHLSILLTDAIVRMTTTDGKVQDFNLTAGATFWSEADTHMAINNGSKPAKAYLIELK